jgi:hypothetical protein
MVEEWSLLGYIDDEYVLFEASAFEVVRRNDKPRADENGWRAVTTNQFRQEEFLMSSVMTPMCAPDQLTHALGLGFEFATEGGEVFSFGRVQDGFWIYWAKAALAIGFGVAFSSGGLYGVLTRSLPKCRKKNSFRIQRYS